MQELKRKQFLYFTNEPNQLVIQTTLTELGISKTVKVDIRKGCLEILLNGMTSADARALLEAYRSGKLQKMLAEVSE